MIKTNDPIVSYFDPKPSCFRYCSVLGIAFSCMLQNFQWSRNHYCSEYFGELCNLLKLVNFFSFPDKINSFYQGWLDSTVNRDLKIYRTSSLMGAKSLNSNILWTEGTQFLEEPLLRG